MLYPHVADFALDLLVAPWSSSASESLFSHAGLLSCGLKTRCKREKFGNSGLTEIERQVTVVNDVLFVFSAALSVSCTIT